MVDWNTEQYERFSAQRSRPFDDLVAVVGARQPREVVDLGCGTGEQLAGLAGRWPTAQLLGIDSSPDMVAKAPAATQRFSVREGDLADFTPTPATDVVISNAALQWVPEHRVLIKAWADALSSGAWLAFQVPGNFGAPSHVLMRQLAESQRWRSRLDGVLRHSRPVDDPADYATALLDRGWHVNAWETTYSQLLPGNNAVLEWVRGTGLRPVLDVLDEDETQEFETEYSSLLDEAYPPTPHGTWFPFRRVFCVGNKA